MKKSIAFLLVALSVASSYAADQVPLFNATLTVGKDNRFVLISGAGQTSSFLRVGDAFDGYTIKAYDAKASALDLERGGKTVRVTLMADATVANGPLAKVTPATIADAAAIMNKIHIDALLERSIGGQKKIFAAQIERIGQNFPNADKDDLAAFKKKVMDEFDSALDTGRMKEDLTKIYSETFSKEELDGISAFYDTPIGQTLLAKQPEVQEKLQASILPRVAGLGPKIQQMAKDFAIDQRAKRDGAGGAATPAVTPPKP